MNETVRNKDKLVMELKWVIANKGKKDVYWTIPRLKQMYKDDKIIIDYLNVFFDG